MIKQLLVVLAIAPLVTACSTSPSSPEPADDSTSTETQTGEWVDPTAPSQEPAHVQTNAELEEQARKALQHLFDTTPKAKDLQEKAIAVVVFPDIVKAGLVVGGQTGKGVMFSPNGSVRGYYRARALSFGMQAGAQSFAEAMFFMTERAVAELTSGTGMSVGVGPSVVLVDAGMARDMNTTTLQSDVYAFIFGQRGLMAGVGVQGQSIVKLDE